MASMAENQVGATKRSRDSHSHLHGPITDFLLLGGGSLFALLAIWYFSDTGEGGITWSISATLAIANIINHPHFAHSYQIFYRNYWEKLTSTRYSFSLRARYLSSGIIFPIVVATFMTWCVVGEHLRILALAANAMFFLVGWHYVKQGYGIAMVDSALKKRFLSPREKNAMLINAYACWGFYGSL